MLTSCGSPNVLREEEIGLRGPRIPSFRLEEHVLEGANAGTSRRDDAFSLVAAVGSYSYKGEDRFVLWRNDSSKQEETEAALAASSKLRSRPLASTIDPFPRLLAFCGVFDGHDGARAADYCAKGLLAHIFLEATELSKKRSPPNASAAGRLRRRFSPSNAKSELATDFALKEAVQELSDPLEAAYVRAFHHAQERFGAGLEPPVPACKLSKLGKQLSWRSLLRPKSQQVVDNLVPGGTTACTLSLHQLEGSGDLLAVVANCGDSRLLTDDGSGSSHFRTVTRDHRVEDVTERARLDRYMETHGQAAHLVQHRDTLRLYPGGLAVSRTIGDVGFTAAAVPTPDVYRIPLWGAGETEGEAREVSETTSQSQEGRKVRFVLATDGIWDILSNTEVGELVAQDGRDGVARSPHEAARAVMNECLRRTGGHHDDTTVLVVDIIQ